MENGEETRAGQEVSTGPTPASSDNDNVQSDHRMTAVINRYESTASGVESRAHRMTAVINRYESTASGVESPALINVVENEEILALAERLMRMPTAEDPGLWKVRVWVSRLYYVSV